MLFFFFFQAEDGIRDLTVTGVQTCALPISVNGVAAFSTLTINRTGTGYTLAASASGLTGNTSATFNITPGTAALLVFTVQPSSATPGAAITPPAQGTPQDPHGNTARPSRASIR